MAKNKGREPCGVPYRAKVGLSVKEKRRNAKGELVDVMVPLCDAGEVTSDIPTCSVGWLLEQGKIEEVSDDG